MDKIQLAAGSFSLIQKDFGLEDSFEPEAHEDPFQALHEFLTKRVQYLLDRDLERLLQALYRIDVPEKNVKQILNLAEPNQMATQLASEILKREKQKVFTRAKYSR